MRRKITVLLIVIVCFLLQTTFFKSLSFLTVSPNLLVIVTASFGFMRGKKEGMYIGLLCGCLIDIFYGDYLCVNALIYMYIGYLNGFFRQEIHFSIFNKMHTCFKKVERNVIFSTHFFTIPFPAGLLCLLIFQYTQIYY